MAVAHTVLFTVLPRGVSLNPAALPVSILVSPRLTGADRLGMFPDWLDWTGRLHQGATLTLKCGARTREVRIDRGPLEPRLWRALFNQDTFVRSRTFDDYSQHGIVSYSVRETLSALKSVYQEASVTLALPDEDADGQVPGQRDRESNRRRLADLLDGLDVHWNPDAAKRWRDVVRHRIRSGVTERAIDGPLDAEGLITAPRNPGAFQAVAVPFSTFHHMPTPKGEAAPPVTFDPDSVDFHQAIGALESHPELLRALGLVFDVTLPVDFVPQTAYPGFSTLSVVGTSLGWQVPPKQRPLETACVHTAAGDTRLFFTASRTQLGGGASPAQILGLLNLDPQRYGLAQVDVDGAMHKVMTVAELMNRPDPGRNLYDSGPEDAPHPEVYDPDATLPSMRSSGLQLFVDRRGAAVLDSIGQSKAFNDALESGGAQPRPFCAEDLVRGYRLDVWESRTNAWHSLHRRVGKYEIGENREPFATEEEEGFFELATTQPAPGAEPADKDLYVHEAIARWAGWSLSVPFPAKALSHHGDPADAVLPNENHPTYETDEALTAFKVRATYSVVKGSLPRLRIGSRYRVRARVVDLAGNSLTHGTPLADGLALAMGLPRDAEGLAYLRYEPVAAPIVVIRDERALTLPGSGVHRLVIRSANDGVEQDEVAADLTASDRHVVPPRTSVELGERHGMFDGPDGKLASDAATWQLAADRDVGRFQEATVVVSGKTLEKIPIEPAETIDALPHLPDPLARGAAIRNLPGSPRFTIGRAAPGAEPAGAIAYEALSDPNPRSGSATLISFNAGANWLDTVGFRLALAEPAAGAIDPHPEWDPASRVLTVYLPKGRTAVVPLSSYVTPADLALMGQWKWMREFVDLASIFFAAPNRLLPGQPSDRIAHVLQRALEGGHWMLTPPTLLTLVHAVQQPIGRPALAALAVDHNPKSTSSNALQTGRLLGRSDPEELAPIRAWRRLGETWTMLTGAIQIHGVSTAKVELIASWTDPVDEVHAPAPGERALEAPADELPLPQPREGYLRAKGAVYRPVGYYDPEHDQIAMVRSGDSVPKGTSFDLTFTDAGPRHEIGDTRRHLVRYTAIATSRYRDYFPQDQDLDFTRASEPVLVDVPASARPLAPDVVYVVPTFGWQRQTDTNLKRSVRFGGGLRVYLRRPWYSSGVGELLGVTLWSGLNGSLDNAARDKFKPFFTQWGMDPVWKTSTLSYAPGTFSFPDSVQQDFGVSLEESNAALPSGAPGRVDVVGYTPTFDETRGLWFADITVDTLSTYSPFVRLALARYQPHALDDARISRVVLADFAQLTPDRTATVTADPHHPRTLRVIVSGVAPVAPLPSGPGLKPLRPTHVNVRVQRRTDLKTDLGWEDAPAAEATVTQNYEGPGLGQPDLALWIGSVAFASPPASGTYRLLIEEFEYVSADYLEGRAAPGRLIYAETFDVDSALVQGGV
jgi:hypothetical protein